MTPISLLFYPLSMKKAVIISGAGSGIGKAAALEFSKQGYFVYLLGRNKEKLEEVAMECRAGARRYSCDLENPGQIHKTCLDILSQQDTDLQILVNNAGVFERQDVFAEDMTVWHRQFTTNLFGAVQLTQGVFPAFKKRGGGSIVNVSSTLGLKTSAQVSAYAASKAAMNSWTQSLALEGGPLKIRANAICPGIVDTPIHSFNKLEAKSKDKVLNSMNGLQPLGRIGTAEEIAKAIVFLGSEASSWTTGAILSVDGGINLV